MTKPQKSGPLLFIFLVVSSLVLAVLIVGDWVPLLRGPAPGTSEWYWSYLLRPFIRWWPSILVAIGMWVVAAWWLVLEKPNQRQNALALSGLIVASLLLQLAIVYADQPAVTTELIDRTLSNLASGFFEPAAEIEDMASVLRNYPQEMTSFTSEHARTHPPGIIVANWLTVQTLSTLPFISEQIARIVLPLRCTDLWLLNRPPEVAAALGLWSILPILAASVSVLPAFGLGRLLLKGRVMRLASILVAMIPALLLFAPKSVQLYAPLTLFVFWAFQKGLKKRSFRWLFLAGAILSLMTYMSLGNAALFLLLLLYAILSLSLVTDGQEFKYRRQEGWIRLFKQMLIFTLATASLWILVWLAWGVPPWGIAQVGLRQHYELVTSLRRYDWWLIWNLIDLVVFAGWPLVLGFFGSLVLAIRFWKSKKLTAVDVLALCLILLIFLLNISGSTRGEVGRIWLFFIPLLAFPAAGFWSQIVSDKNQILTIVALQLLMVISLGIAWRPVRAVIVVAERPLMPDAAPDNALDAHFTGEPIALSGFSVRPTLVKAGGELDLTLFWQAEGPAQRPYTVFNHLSNDSGKLVAQQDNWPVDGRWPPTCWHSGESIVDTHTILLPHDLPAGQYSLVTGLYDAQTGARLSLEEGGDALYLQSFTISP